MHVLTTNDPQTNAIIDVLFAGTPGECIEEARRLFVAKTPTYPRAMFNVIVEPQAPADDPLWGVVEWIVGGKTERLVIRAVASGQLEPYVSSAT